MTLTPLDISFRDAIIREPHDDGLRLIYADWLDDGRDHDRAEFIRLQCRMERLAFDDPNYPELEKQADALLERNLMRWVAEDLSLNEMQARFLELDWAQFPEGEGEERHRGIQARFRRGFVGGLVLNRGADIPGYVQIHHLDDFMRHTPITELTFLTQARGDLAALAKNPSFARIESLRLDNCHTPHAIHTLATSPHNRLKNFQMDRPGEEVMNTLRRDLKHGRFATLERFDVFDGIISAEQHTEIERAPGLVGMEWVRIPGAPPGGTSYLCGTRSAEAVAANLAAMPPSGKVKNK